MKSFFKVIRFIINHPIGKRSKWNCIQKFIRWQISQVIFNYPAVHPFVENSRLFVSKGMKGATGNIYVGLHECEDMAFVLHFMQPGDVFFDIGANIGSYTILASAVSGCNTVTLEPVPSTFEFLQTNIFLNKIESKVTSLNYGAGAAEGKLFFTTGNDTVNHVVLNPQPGERVVEVPVNSLDNIADTTGIPCCIKIDVEGFETEVLNGAYRLLKNDMLQAIIIELIGAGTAFGYDEKDIDTKLRQNGFMPYQYEPFSRELVYFDGITSNNNIIYIKDKEAVLKKLRSAKKRLIMNVEI